MDFFISYNSRDRQHAVRIGEKLRALGVTAYLDQWYLKPGTHWIPELEKALAECNVFLVVVGPHGLSSWQHREFEAVLTRPEDIPIVPVILPGGEPPSLILGTYQYLDLRDDSDFQQVKVLVSVLQGDTNSDPLLKKPEQLKDTFCPFRSLLPFREEDAKLFFGRDVFTTKLVEIVGLRNVVAVVGRSGSGKSSVVRAGLVPHLRAAKDKMVWEIVTCTPTDRPFYGLAEGLIPVLEPDFEQLSQVEFLRRRAELAKSLANGTIELRDVVQQILDTQPGTNRLLLVVDQWEELYAFEQDEDSTSQDHRSLAFIDQVLNATVNDRCAVVCTLRADFYGRVLSHRELSDRLQGAVVNLAPMNRTELKEIIEKPAELVGLTFQPGLVEEILDDLSDEPGALPLLEFMLTRMWDERSGNMLTLETYQSLNGVRGAMAKRADEVSAALDAREKSALPQVFSRLVQLVPSENETRALRKRAELGELDNAAKAVVAKLAEARLLVTAETTVEVAHEALIDRWGELQKWVERNREFLLWRHRLNEAVREWSADHRDRSYLYRGPRLAEPRNWLKTHRKDLSESAVEFIEASNRWHRLRRFTVAAAVAVALIGVVIGGFTWYQQTLKEWPLLVTIEPVDAQFEIDGIERSADKSGAFVLPMRRGSHNYRASADYYEYLQGEFDFNPNDAKPLEVSLQPLTGTLTAICEQPGGQIELNGMSHGSRMEELPVKLGQDHSLLAWAYDHFESRQDFELLLKDEQFNHRFWLDHGPIWRRSSPHLQGALMLVDHNGDGVPDIAHNEINETVVFSGKDGRKLWRKYAPRSGLRTFMEADLGGDVGRVLLAGKDEKLLTDEESPPRKLHAFALSFKPVAQRTDPNDVVLWDKWIGPPQSSEGDDAAFAIAPVGDQNGDGVREVVLGGRDGQLYVLDGRTGEQVNTFAIYPQPLEHSPYFFQADDAASNQVGVYMRPAASSQSDGPQDSLVAHSFHLADGSEAWEKPQPIYPRQYNRDLNGDGSYDIYAWNETNWMIVSAADGNVRSRGKFPADVGPVGNVYIEELDGNGRALELILIPVDKSKRLTAASLDGAPIWQGPSNVQTNQFVDQSQLWRTPDGDLLISLGSPREDDAKDDKDGELKDALVAVSPKTGRTVWRLEGKPTGVRVGDWEGDGIAEIFVGVEGRGLVCLDANGAEKWVLRLHENINPYALMPDIDRDGLAEILIHRHAVVMGVVRGPRILWRWRAEGQLQATPIVTECDGRLQVIQLGPWTSPNPLTCLDAATGRELWTIDDGKIFLAPNRRPALADWDNDGVLDVVGVGMIPDKQGWYIHAIRSTDGQLLPTTRIASDSDVYSRPEVADINGDRWPDLAIARWTGKDIIAVDGKDGRLLWSQKTGKENVGGVAIADLNGDGFTDVVAPSDDGNVYAISGKPGAGGEPVSVWPAPVIVGQGGIRSLPLLEDLNDDEIPDVLVISHAGTLHILDGRDGTSLAAWTVAGAGEALGHPAVKKTGERTLIVTPLGDAGLVAFEFPSGKQIWTSRADEHPVLAHPVSTSPVIDDLDGDGLHEVVASTAEDALLVLDLESGQLLWQIQFESTSDETGDVPLKDVSGAAIQRAEEVPLEQPDPVVIRDIDGDRVRDILIAGHNYYLTAVSGRGTIGARQRLSNRSPTTASR